MYRRAPRTTAGSWWSRQAATRAPDRIERCARVGGSGTGLTGGRRVARHRDATSSGTIVFAGRARRAFGEAGGRRNRVKVRVSARAFGRVVGTGTVLLILVEHHRQLVACGAGVTTTCSVGSTHQVVAGPAAGRESSSVRASSPPSGTGPSRSFRQQAVDDARVLHATSGTTGGLGGLA